MAALCKEDRARGESVNEILAADWAKLTGGEKPGQRKRSDDFLHRLCIVVSIAEHSGAAAVAKESQRSGWNKPRCLHH